LEFPLHTKVSIKNRNSIQQARNAFVLAIETVDGGIPEDVVISNIVVSYIISSPIFLRLGAWMR
jgi:hypothetical protein